MFKNKLIEILNKDYIFFRVGLFLLPSAFSVAGFFIIISLISQTIKKRYAFLQDKQNILLLLISSLMVISCIVQNLFSNFDSELIIEKHLTWIGLFNWIPFFWVFWSSQGFLKTKNDRKLISMILILSTIPVIFSGISQYYFGVVGPFRFLNGLIIWYQRPIDKFSGLTGLFNNANYAGSWLTIILPLCLAQSFCNSNKVLRKIIFRTILVGIILCIILTNSRNAWGSSIITLPLIFGFSSLRWFIPLLLFLASIILTTTQNIFKGSIQEFLKNIIPDRIWLEFTNINFSQMDLTRLEIFKAAIKLVILNPLFGTGAASFPVFYELQTSFWLGHSHNLFTELSLSYGLPSTIILITFLCNILFFSFKNIYLQKESNIYEKGFFVAIVVFLLSQLVDIQYFDGRISLVFWLLLAGLKCIIDEYKFIKYE